MLDSILIRDDVLKIINNLQNNEKYYKKKSNNEDKYYYKDEALYVFYEALLKYKIVLDDVFYLDDYIYDLDLLFRKIDNIDNIRFGISKLITKFSVKMLQCDDLDREKILKFIYDKYIINGYLIHGFSTTYVDKILEDGFIVEKYNNYYDDFKKINNIFHKHNMYKFIDKDFNKLNAYFTDDVIESCVYSRISPLYFSKLLCDNEIIKNKMNYYYEDNKEMCIKNIKKICNELSFNSEEKEYILNVVNKEFELLNKVDKNISILLVKRNMFDLDDISLDEIINSDLDLYECCDSILSSKFNNIILNKNINSNDIVICNFKLIKEDIVDVVKVEKEEIKKHNNEEKVQEFKDTYGMVSPLLLMGSLFICFGVIISIISFLGGR